MRIGVLSDSHGNIVNLQDAVIKLNQLNVDAIFHLGDYVRDAQKIKVWCHKPVYSIKGNCDINASTGLSFARIKFNNKIVFATHGHLFNVKQDLDALYYTAVQKGADIVLFGHTHRKLLMKKNDILIMNPGSLIGGRYSEAPSYGYIEISNDNISGKLFELNSDN
ncbi:metallophosphoesterase family protein [Pseudoramibacter sp.]|uniref:metallophosphoesterase family protein n=1 Tax=Pseudoramibacter sp. TaxID=2034862 RepID=UPI0025FC354D|nr:metallophosphoesterase [Pseudoramibacter sp.]MCH4072844.1 metallophosphoesterase [Pseudoramibacter sp.]MCH4106615.1 metallophosphoesterase [Pseudoramibacter sp.]